MKMSALRMRRDRRRGGFTDTEIRPNLSGEFLDGGVPLKRLHGEGVVQGFRDANVHHDGATKEPRTPPPPFVHWGRAGPCAAAACVIICCVCGLIISCAWIWRIVFVTVSDATCAAVCWVACAMAFCIMCPCIAWA